MTLIHGSARKLSGRGKIRLKSFPAAQRGGVTVLVAMMLVPLILASGAAIDYARLEILKTSLQSVTDGAALAGASALCLASGSTDATTVATDYFNKGVTDLATTATVGSPTVSLPSTIAVTVTALATLQYSLMSLIGTGLTVAVSATAEGPAYALQVTNTGGFSSSAYDSDSVYFYTVSSSGTLPTSTSSMTLLFTNDPKVDSNYVADNAEKKSISIGFNDRVGFALVNVTGSLHTYGANGYGGKQASTHYFYSSATVPSAAAYSSQGTFTTGQTVTTTTTNSKGHKTTATSCNTTAITAANTTYVSTANDSCNAHPCTELSGNAVLENNLLVTNSNTCSTAATATKTCAQLYDNALAFAWNDMGGGSDDFDYNDAAYTVSCVPTSSDPQPNSVILVQ